MTSLAAVVFDVDGTLVDSADGFEDPALVAWFRQ